MVFYLFIFFAINDVQAIELSHYFKDKWPLGQTAIELLTKGEIIVDSHVTTHSDNLQEFHMKVAAFHPKSCSKVLKKISQFELYPDWISYITKIVYKEDEELLVLHADHVLLPYPMVVDILVKRPTKEGNYSFIFPTGIFSGLKGNAEIADINGRCLLYTTSHWKGPHTKLSAFMIELFSETLTRIGANILIKKTLF